MVPRFYRLPAGTLTQLEMSQKRLEVLGRTLGHTASLGVFCWLEVADFDHFFGFLFLVFHVCYLSFAGLFMVCLFVLRCKNKQFSSRLERTFEASHLAPLFAPDSPRHTVTFHVATAN